MTPDPTEQDLEVRQQRRSTRRAFGWWGGGLALVVCAVILVWVFAFIPNTPASRQTAGPAAGSTGELTNQGSGQSQAAKNNAVEPRTNPSVGTGQNAPGAAAQIEQSAGPLKLTDQQRGQIRNYFAGKQADRLDSAGFSLAIGAAVPQGVKLQELPPDVSSTLGGYKGDQYVLVRNQLVIVDPSARRVVAIVPDAG